MSNLLIILIKTCFKAILIFLTRAYLDWENEIPSLWACKSVWVSQQEGQWEFSKFQFETFTTFTHIARPKCVFKYFHNPTSPYFKEGLK